MQFHCFRSVMWLNNTKAKVIDDSDVDSVSSGEEIPIWVRGEQRWVSGISEETTCQDVIHVLLQDEEIRVCRITIITNENNIVTMHLIKIGRCRLLSKTTYQVSCGNFFLSSNLLLAELPLCNHQCSYSQSKKLTPIFTTSFNLCHFKPNFFLEKTSTQD